MLLVHGEQPQSIHLTCAKVASCDEWCDARCLMQTRFTTVSHRVARTVGVVRAGVPAPHESTKRSPTVGSSSTSGAVIGLMNGLRDGSRGLKLFRVRSGTYVDHNGEVAAVAPVDWHNLHCKRQPISSALEIAAVEYPKLLG